MRSLSVRRLTASSFAEALREAPYLLVRVEPGLPRIHRGLPRFFASQYPDLFAFGTLPARETRTQGWWDRNFRTSVGPVKGSRTGYFLLQEGEVVGHHSGQVRADLTFSDATATWDDTRRGHRELEWVQRVAFGESPVDSLELAAAFELIAYFDGVVRERQQRTGFDGDTRAPGGQAGRVCAQPVPIPGASGDPFEVLKIGPDATAGEIKAAYKLQMKRNHPDKLVHMSEELQAYAAAQVRVIKAAYEVLVPPSSRGTPDD